MRGKLIVLKGVNFHAVPAACGHCGWSGTAGSLTVPGAGSLADGVTYHCPVCETAVAHHNGLSDAEVQGELVNIRRELQAELRSTLRIAEGDSPARPHPNPKEPELTDYKLPTFDEVRSRIRDLR